MENCLYDLDAPVRRVCAVEAPIPYAAHLEHAAVPQPESIMQAVLEVLGK